jgi:hypothetical protein
MALTTLASKGSKLNAVEMDNNLLYLSTTLSASGADGIISVTGSTIQAPNTSITASYFKGDGSKLTNITASYSPAAGSNTYIQYNNSGILGAEAAFTYNATSNTLTVSNITATNVQVAKGIDTGNGYLLDGGDITSVDWKNRTLNWPDGSPAFNWSTQDAVKFININDAAGAADKILVLRSSTSQVFITGSSAFSTPTSSLLVTASATNNIITFTKGNGSTFNVTVNTGSLNYYIYSATLDQTGTNAPIATVLQNTFPGNIVWSRQGNGWYRATLTGAFTYQKTMAFSSIASDGLCSKHTFSLTNSNYIQFFTYDQFGTRSDVMMNATTPIEIRVYP